MLRRDEAFDPPVCHIGVGCDNRGSSEDLQELRLAVGRLETELKKSFPRSLHSPDTQDRGVGDLFVSTRDESTAMTARRLDNNGSRCVSEVALGTSDKWADEWCPFEGVSSESISAIAMDTGPSSTGRMQPMESNRAGRRRDAIRSAEEHWELLMRSAEASRRDLRSRAVAASRGQPMTPEASEARRYSSPIPAERESFIGYRSVSLPHVMSSRRRSAPFAQYRNIAFDGSKGSTEALRKWLFGDGSLRGAEIGVVLSSRSNAGGLERAKKHGIPTVLVESRKYRKSTAGSGGNKTAPDWEAMSEAVTEALIPFKPDILVLAGYMCLYKLPTAWETGRCLNVSHHRYHRRSSFSGVPGSA
ncbi:hypothetical protein FOZ63_000074 [Perkinsus olseni]|uniref:Uncharacterized protein n=1 Tax=Perkinsus olseni TaxID=32597 RepID=A0A7J6U3J0_PEROL|nr:hypothetical protein FOZ63_000074 [Perkinsus olseni]